MAVILQRVIAVLAVLALLPLVSFAGIIEGRLAYRRAEYATALKEFSEGAQSGPIGTFFLALMYLRGEGVPRDEGRGLTFLRNSADAGHAPAQYLLGQYFLYGQLVPRNRGQALSYLLAASVGDDYRAVVLLKILEKGSRGEKKDRERIVAEVKRRARSNDPHAQYTLALMYLVGDGVPKDGVEEVRWYRVASSKNSRAAFMLSLMYHYGEGVPKNPQEAIRLMAIAAQLGDTRARYYLGTFYHQGIGTQIDRQSAAEWFRLAAENGDDDAQLAYGMVLLAGDGVVQDKARAIEWLGKAASQDNSRAREIIRELLIFRGQPSRDAMADMGDRTLNPEKRQNESQLRLEGKGVLLDQGTFGLKFSLPTLYDAYAPQNLTSVQPIWDRLQGGVLDIIIRPPR